MNHKAHQLILHFGLEKTGTSALQRALFDHRDQLLKNHNTHYPGKYENHSYLQGLFSEQPESLFQIQILELEDRDAVAIFLEEYRENILSEINEDKPHRIIISSECFVGMTIDELRAMRTFFETIAENITLFAYVRNPWSWSISLLQEQILTGYIKKEAKVIYIHTLSQLLGRFEDAFGIRAIIAPYLKESDNFNVVEDFCKRFDLNSLVSVAHENAHVRTGMKREATCVMLQLNQLYPVFDENMNYIPDPVREMMRQAIRYSPLSTTPLRISTKTAQEIYENSKVDIEFLEERYFEGKKYFTEYYNTLQTTDFDDTLSTSSFNSEQLSEFLLSCMHDVLTVQLGLLSAQLEEIKKSKAWKIGLFFRRLRILLFPVNGRHDQV